MLEDYEIPVYFKEDFFRVLEVRAIGISVHRFSQPISFSMPSSPISSVLPFTFSVLFILFKPKDGKGHRPSFRWFLIGPSGACLWRTVSMFARDLSSHSNE